MDGNEELLSRFEQAKNDLENHISTVDGMITMNDIRRMEYHETQAHDLMEDLDKLTEIVKYLLNWRLHSVKRSINMVREMIEKEEDEA